MKEEFVTRSIIDFLKSRGWIIDSYDYPQSGRGDLIHPNDRRYKNKKSIIPDIIAYKDSICIIMENKPYFYPEDFTKLDDLRYNEIYTDSLKRLIDRLNCNKIFYGVGLPNTVDIFNKDTNTINLVDFIITVDKSKNCEYFIF